jgi:hypothetical protein
VATFGEALAALEDFRSELVDRQLSTAAPDAQALAFPASAGGVGDTPLRRIHATGVGVRANKDKPGPNDFAIKVFVFEQADVQAVKADAFLAGSYNGVDIDVEHLPVQLAFGRVRVPRPTGTPAQHQQRRRPVPAGVEIGPLGGTFVGTLGCFVRRGPGNDGPLFALSNNHILAGVNRFPLGTQFTQPFSANEADIIAALSDFEPIRFPAPGSQPRNVIDAAIAAVTDPRQVVLGRMLNISRYTPQLFAARPGMPVTKAGRTTGVTRGMIRAVRVRGVQVNYGTRQSPLLATFDDAITITGSAGTAFSNPGDSGAVILDVSSGRPVALLFAGSEVTTTACDVAAACARFNVRPV